MNIHKCIKAAKICAIAGAFLLPANLSHAETIVHTTRYLHDAANGTPVNSDVKSKQNANAAATKKQPTPRKSIPYTWDEALEYAKMHREDITPHKIGGYKDKYGNFSKVRVLDFLGKAGLSNSGMSFFGTPDHTFLRVTLDYGQASNPRNPIAVINWATDRRYLGNDTPTYLKIVFESGYEKKLPIKGKMLSTTYINWALFFPTWAKKYSSHIELTNEDIWDIYKHGDIANIYIDDGYKGGVSFFYSGEKQEEHKRQLTYGFEHIVRLLNITPATIEYERKQREVLEKKAYRNQLRAEAKKEIYKDEIKKEITKEVKKEIQEDKRFIEEWEGK